MSNSFKHFSPLRMAFFQNMISLNALLLLYSVEPIFTANSKVAHTSSRCPVDAELLSHLRAAATILLNFFKFARQQNTHNISDTVW